MACNNLFNLNGEVWGYMVSRVFSPDQFERIYTIMVLVLETGESKILEI